MKWLKAIGQSENITEIVSICADEMQKRGADRSSYHVSPSYSSLTSADTLVVHRGFPESWVDLFRERNYRACDPICEHVMASGTTMSWQATIDLQDLTPKQAEMVNELHAHGLRHGVASPLFGPSGMEAYIAIGFDDQAKLEDPDPIREMIIIAQAGHRRASAVMQKALNKQVSLSRREAEVLHWIARSKSNNDIATILGVSATTIEVYVRRLYEKLEVHDRIAATVRGLRWGLVKL